MIRPSGILRDWQNSTELTAAEQATLAATDDVLNTGVISEEVWNRCVEHIPGGEGALFDLVVSTGNWSMFSTLLRSLKVPLEAGVQSWPPDGRIPESTK